MDLERVRPAPTRAIPVLFNSSAGIGRKEAPEELERGLQEAGIHAIVVAAPPERLPDEAAARATAGDPIVAVAGGDGTIRGVAEALAGGPAAIGVLPLGTLNHFARRVGIENTDQAMDALRDPHIEHVAVGRVGERIFLNTATFGLYADVVRRRDRWRPRLGKWPAAFVSFLVTLFRLRHVHVTLELEGERIERRTPLLWVGLGYGSFPRVTEAEEHPVEAPDFELSLFRPHGRLGLALFAVRMSWRIAFGKTPVRDPAVEILHARRFSLDAHRRIGVTLDGEVMASVASVEVSVWEGALGVVVGPDFTGAGG